MAQYSVSKAVVTGGARGLGAAIGERLAREGLSVALLDVNGVGAEETAAAIAEATGSTAVGSILIDFISRWPLTSTLTTPPPAVPSTTDGSKSNGT